jgi:hypothetical protein
MSYQGIIRRIRFGHVTLILGLVAAAVTYAQATDGLSPPSAALFVFFWTIVATWVSREFFRGDLMEEVDEHRRMTEDWRATVVDFRQEAQELERENDELRETIKVLSRENYALKQAADDDALEESGVDDEETPAVED